MRIIAGHKEIARAPLPGGRRSVVIGNFDGVHRGHQHVFSIAKEVDPGAQVAVLTFEPHPARVLAPGLAPPLLCTLPRKRELLAACGIDLLIEEPFDAAFAALSPAAFVDEVLVGALQASHVCVGYDFTFGQGRAGTPETLVELLGRYGRKVTVVPPFSVPDPDDPACSIVCSSTRVRQEMAAGRPERAALILGRDPEVEGTVVPGAGRGRTIGVPTANLRPDTEVQPGPGVYAAWAEILDPERRVVARYPAAVNVGCNPTFRASGETGPPGIEAHLILGSAEGDLPPLYGRTLRLGLRARLRGERRFPSVEALVEQIHADIAQAARILERP
ncbi:MAG: riboflavin biosynthesis protein RibF [Myxococcales bacterium]|nr:riboflavin biosynthesis protein RibF [Myxococcota bacterium]MDW8280431.1 riboflavin biosynthesis protein RibF [Myxococcales bacterium]